MPSQRKTFLQDFRTFFLRGLAILLPSIITLGLLLWAFSFLRDRVAEPMNAGVRYGVVFVAPKILPDEHLPEWLVVSDATIEEVREERSRTGRPTLSTDQLRTQIRRQNLAQHWQDRWYLQAIGFVVAIVLIYLAGILLGGLIGRRVYHRLEQTITRLPIIKQVYPNVKQITDFLIGGNQGGFSSTLPGADRASKVVIVEYPRRGVWTMGLLTGGTLRTIEEKAGRACSTVFIPSSPTPFTGYTITVPSDDVHELPISLDEAIRFCVSGGVLVPDHQMIPKQAGEQTPGLPPKPPPEEGER